MERWQHKNTDTNPCQTVLRASQNQASTLDCRKETPCSNPELVVRECGLMLQGMVSVFLFDCLAFYESAEFVPIFPGKSGRKIRSLYRDSWRPFCQSCIPAGLFAIYMTDGTENPSMEFPDFLLHTFILHKHPFFTTFLKNFTLMCR